MPDTKKHAHEYPKPSLTADIIVFKRTVNETLQVLLVRRGRPPYQGSWALPGGFVNPTEDVMDAAKRELEEETHVSNVDLELCGIYGAPGRDPRGWTASGAYCCVVDTGTSARAGDDAADARWFDISESHDGDEILLTLTCDDEKLTSQFCATPQKFGAPRASNISGSGLAFDHAHILADAYLKVTA